LRVRKTLAVYEARVVKRYFTMGLGRIKHLNLTAGGRRKIRHYASEYCKFI
jgi:hypothetical protein